MLDTLTSQNHRDFGARYGGTYGWYLGEGRKILVYVHRADSEQVSFTDRHGSRYFSRADSGVQFEFIPVSRGFFNGPQESYYLTRVPARQWHRGIAPQNTNIALLSKFRNGNGQFVPMGVSFDALHDIFDSKLNPKDLYQKWCKKERTAVALSKHFALVGDDDLFFYRERVGKVKEGVATLSSDLVEQEVKDAIRRAGVSIEVKVKND